MKLVKFNSWAAPQEALYVRVFQVIKASSPTVWSGTSRLSRSSSTSATRSVQLQTGIDRIPGPSEEVRRTSRGSLRKTFCTCFWDALPGLFSGLTGASVCFHPFSQPRKFFHRPWLVKLRNSARFVSRCRPSESLSVILGIVDVDQRSTFCSLRHARANLCRHPITALHR